MKISLIKQTGHILEIITLCLLLLYFSGAQVPEGLESLVKVGSYGIVALMVVLKGRLQRLTYVGTRDIPLLLLLGVCTASFFWSAAPDSTYNTLKALLRTSLVGVYLATHYTPKQQMHLFALVSGIAAILSITLTLILPNYGVTGYGSQAELWTGVYSHKQFLGRMMAVGEITLLMTALDSPKYRWWALFGFVLTVALIILSGSRTSWIALGFAMALMPFNRIFKQEYKKRVLLLVFSLFLIEVLVILVTSNIEIIIVDILGKSLDLSSRGPVWEFAMEEGLKRPLFGYGYQGFWPSLSLGFIASKFWPTTSFHGHNGFVDMFLEVGLVGLLLCCLNFFLIVPRTLKLMSVSKGLENFWMLQFFNAILIFNITEASTFVANNIFWMFTVSICLSSRIYCQRLERQKKNLQSFNKQVTKLQLYI